MMWMGSVASLGAASEEGLRLEEGRVGVRPSTQQAYVEVAYHGVRDGRLKVISNCRVLGEGVDVPAVDLVAFIDAKSSHVDILQSVARASRVSPGKECGLVLVMAGTNDLADTALAGTLPKVPARRVAGLAFTLCKQNFLVGSACSCSPRRSWSFTLLAMKLMCRR